MLNRTLSANTNRRNLGTRSLAFVAGLNTGFQTLRVRHAHPSKRMDSLRLGSSIGKPDPIGISDDVPSSPFGSAWPVTRPASWTRVGQVVPAWEVSFTVAEREPYQRAEQRRGQSAGSSIAARLGRGTAPAGRLGGRACPGLAPAVAMCRMTLPSSALAFAAGG